MKRLLLIFTCLACVVSCQKKFDEINGRLDSLEAQIESLSNIKKDIVSLQSIVEALQNYNYVTDIVPVKENGEEIGYEIHFSKGDKITIYHGNDGASPVMGIKQDENGVYYWTINGEWAKDEKGNKIPTTGQDGLAGVTPKIKIEKGQWYVSYDNEVSWSALDQSSGVSLIASITTDAEFVYLTQIDGTVIKLPLADDNYVKDLRSLTFIPRYDDGKPIVISVSKETSYVDLDFEVSPKQAVTDIITYWSKHADVKAVNTITKSSTFIDMPIISVTGDVNEGIITVKASAKGLSDAFFAGNQGVSVAMHITDGNYNISSGYISVQSPVERIEHPYDGLLKVIAHRGFWKSKTAGEAQNSLAALRAAEVASIWGCEVDIWETSDNILLVNHDGAINGAQIEISPYSTFKDHVLANGETIPTFEQYLTVFKNECHNLVLIVEIKPHSGVQKTVSATRAAIDMIRKMGLEDRVEYISFSKVACDEVVRYSPAARVAYLEADLTPYDCAVRGYSAMDCPYAGYKSNPTWIDDAHKLGLEVNAWTINGRSDIAAAYSMGLDMITTDRPDIVEGIVSAL